MVPRLNPRYGRIYHATSQRAGLAELTPREREVLSLIATGASNREMAEIPILLASVIFEVPETRFLEETGFLIFANPTQYWQRFSVLLRRR